MRAARRGVVDEHAVAAEHVGDEVVGEDRERVEVVELRDARQRQVVGGDLRALVEAVVGEERALGREPRREPLGRAARAVDQVQRAAVAQQPPELAQRLGEQAHELQAGVLAERRGDLLGRHRAQVGPGPRAVRAPVVAQFHATVK